MAADQDGYVPLRVIIQEAKRHGVEIDPASLLVGVQLGMRPDLMTPANETELRFAVTAILRLQEIPA